MTQLETPKNLTRNVLIGMFAGVLFASLFYYSQEFISQQIFLFVEKRIKNHLNITNDSLLIESGFLKLYKTKPIQNNFSGMKVEHCFAFYCLLKKLSQKKVRLINIILKIAIKT